MSHLPARSFSPRDVGTSEADWQAYLWGLPTWKPDFESLLVVSPHPDDETLGAGGLIQSAVARGCRVAIISVTAGEAARPNSPGLAQRRAGELQASMHELAGGTASIHITQLQVPDGKVALHETRIRQAVLDLADPRGLLVCPFERDGHPDHDASGRACLEAAQSAGLRLARYPIWTWHWASAEIFTGYDVRRVGMDDRTMAIKSRALLHFRSQLDDSDQDAIVPPHVLTHFTRSFETFIL